MKNNIQKIIEEKIKGLREFYVEMHPMHGHDTHNPPLLYNSKSEDVDELFESIRQALNQIRQETIEEVNKEVDETKRQLRQKIQEINLINGSRNKNGAEIVIEISRILNPFLQTSNMI